MTLDDLTKEMKEWILKNPTTHEQKATCFTCNVQTDMVRALGGVLETYDLTKK